MKKYVLTAAAAGLLFAAGGLAVYALSVSAPKYDNKINFADKVYNQNVRTENVRINVASYNIKSGGTTAENIEKIEEQLSQYGVHIAGLQEVDTDDSKRTNGGQYMTRLTKGDYKNHFFAPTYSLQMGEKYGIMTVSSQPFEESDAFALPLPGRFFIFKGEPRVATRNVVNIDGVQVAFYNTHLSVDDAKMKSGEELRVAQLKYILSLMEKDPCQYKILTGDFNIASFDELEPFLENENYGLMNTAEKSYESFHGGENHFNCIDNIIYTSNLQPVREEMAENDLSDHNMLFAQFEIKN